MHFRRNAKQQMKINYAHSIRIKHTQHQTTETKMQLTLAHHENKLHA